MPLNQSAVGKRYGEQRTTVTLPALQQYARAYDHLNPFFFDPASAGGIVAPPMFGITLVWKSIVEVVSDPALNVDLLRLVHSQHEVEFFVPLAPGDEISAAATIAAIEPRPGGQSLVIELPAHNQRGELVQKTIFTALIRGPGGGRHEAEAGVARGLPLIEVQQPIALDQTVRYAEASGDHNPIHLDENVAKMAGLPGIIVHGMCTLALCSKPVIDQLCEGDPRRLRRLRARFQRFVLPGQTLTIRLWAAEPREQRQVYEFEALNPAGRAALRDGLAEVGAQA